MKFGVKKPETSTCRMVRNVFRHLERLGVDRECDGRTDRQTDGHNSNSAVYYSLHAPSSNTQYQNKNLNKQGKVAFDLPLQSPGPRSANYSRL